MHKFTVIWANIGDDCGKRLDHVTVAEPTKAAVMDAAFACYFAEIEEGGETLADYGITDRDEFRRKTPYDGHAIIAGHVTDAPGLSFA